MQRAGRSRGRSLWRWGQYAHAVLTSERQHIDARGLEEAGAAQLTPTTYPERG